MWKRRAEGTREGNVVNFGWQVGGWQCELYESTIRTCIQNKDTLKSRAQVM